MRRATWKIFFSLAAAATIAFAAFVLLEAVQSGAHASTSNAALFRFQVSSMIAMGVFAGVAIVIYVRLSRRE